MGHELERSFLFFMDVGLFWILSFLLQFPLCFGWRSAASTDCACVALLSQRFVSLSWAALHCLGSCGLPGNPEIRESSPHSDSFSNCWWFIFLGKDVVEPDR